MIESLHIRNLALVSALEMEFGPGLNVITGETGAGKSLILGAFQLLLGGRADKSLIRQGEDSCEVSAVFNLAAAMPAAAAEVVGFLEEAGLPAMEEQRLLLRRVLTASSGRCQINGGSVTLAVLRQLGERLMDIHGPNEHQTLLLPQTQAGLLDAYADLEPALAASRQAWEQWRGAERALALAQSETVSGTELEFLRYQLAELEKARLKPGEEEEINARHKTAASAKRLVELASRSARSLGGDEDGLADRLGRCLAPLEEMAELDPQGAGAFPPRLEAAIESLRDLAGDLEQYAEAAPVDAEELAALEERLGVLQKIRRKYGGSVETALALAASLRERIAQAESREERLEQLAAAIAQAEQHYRGQAETLAAARRQAAAPLAREIAAKLQALGFLQAQFEIRVATAAAGPSGTDAVEFLFAPNPGEGMQPLRKIASSGEAARVMLAIKTVLSAADQVPVLLFDEVDANIGGRVAVQVAREMRHLGGRHQVFSVTHLAQLAAAGHRHYQVSKQVKEGRTLTQMEQLSASAREQELIRMTGATAGSAAALGHVREIVAEVAGDPPAPSSPKRARK